MRFNNGSSNKDAMHSEKNCDLYNTRRVPGSDSRCGAGLLSAHNMVACVFWGGYTRS